MTDMRKNSPFTLLVVDSEPWPYMVLSNDIAVENHPIWKTLNARPFAPKVHPHPSLVGSISFLFTLAVNVSTSGRIFPHLLARASEAHYKTISHDLSPLY